LYKKFICLTPLSSHAHPHMQIQIHAHQATNTPKASQCSLLCPRC